MIAGVCAGLGEYFDLDPVLFRVGFVVLAILGGAGLIVYLLAWWLLPVQAGPDDPAAPPLGQRTYWGMRGSSAWIWGALVVAGIALLLSDIGNHGAFSWAFRPGIVWGTALILFGVLLYQRSGNRRTGADVSPGGSAVPMTSAAGIGAASVTGSPAFDPSEPMPATPSVAFSGSSLQPATAGATTVPVGYPVARGTARRRQGSPLGWVTLGVTLLAVGTLALVDQADGVTVTVAQYLAVALAVLGLGLLVGTWWGRARWLIVPAILLVPFVLAASLIDVPLTGGTGTRFYQPVTIADIQPEYHLTAGEMRFDLRNTDLAGASASITATVGFGTLVVVVPNDVPVKVHALVGAGQIRLRSQPFDPSEREVDGMRVRLDQTFGVSTGTGAIVLNLQAGFGQISIFREVPDGSLG